VNRPRLVRWVLVGGGRLLIQPTLALVSTDPALAVPPMTMAPRAVAAERVKMAATLRILDPFRVPASSRPRSLAYSVIYKIGGTRNLRVSAVRPMAGMTPLHRLVA